MNEEKNMFTEKEITGCLEILKNFAEHSQQLSLINQEQKIALLKYCGIISRPCKDEIRLRQKEARNFYRQSRKETNKSLRRLTGIRSAREAAVFVAPAKIAFVNSERENLEYISPKECYICRNSFREIHHFYDSMCLSCGDYNYKKRFQTADLRGQVAIITGSRLKIGYQATLMLLRAGATVIATTRFPVDSAIRYSKESDFDHWKDRLRIYGLDLRHIPSVEMFAQYIAKKYSRLDILINNAAQTVKRPPGFYKHLMELEKAVPDSEVRSLLCEFYACIGEFKGTGNHPVSWSDRTLGLGLVASAELSQVPFSFEESQFNDVLFPQGKLDQDLQQIDLRKNNSWRLKLGEISVPEMVEVQLVNSIAPFVLCNRLITLMKKDLTGKKHIVNVSAMEGKFHRFKKESRHPHTNMAKAALNMLSHTAATDLAKDGIFINSVDTGWVTDEDPADLVKIKQEIHDFQPPLDIVDGAARVCDPIFDGINSGSHWSGKFLKDFFPIDW